MKLRDKLFFLAMSLVWILGIGILFQGDSQANHGPRRSTVHITSLNDANVAAVSATGALSVDVSGGTNSFVQSTAAITTNSTGIALDMAVNPMSKFTMVVDRTVGATDVVEIDLLCSAGAVFVQIATITSLANEPALASIDGTACQDIQYQVVTIGAGNTLSIELLAAR